MPGGFYDLLFEVSNENRYEIIVSLRKKAKRITDITREMDLTTPEARRHVSRLVEVGLIQRDIEGYYHLTPYGEIVLIQLKEFDFMSRHRNYLLSHVLTNIPPGFLKRRLQVTIDQGAYSIDLFNDWLKPGEEIWLLIPDDEDAVIRYRIDDEPAQFMVFYAW